MTDTRMNLNLISPNIITQSWDGSIFAELEAKFSVPSLRYHSIGRYVFHCDDMEKIVNLAKNSDRGLLKIRTISEMTVFDLMTGGDVGDECVNDASEDETDFSQKKKLNRTKSIKKKLEEYNDCYLSYDKISMPEIEVEVSVSGCAQVERARMKLKRVIRFNHLTRDFVDEDDYPPTQEYFLYSDKTVSIFTSRP